MLEDLIYVEIWEFGPWWNYRKPNIVQNISQIVCVHDCKAYSTYKPFHIVIKTKHVDYTLNIARGTFGFIPHGINCEFDFVHGLIEWHPAVRACRASSLPTFYTVSVKRVAAFESSCIIGGHIEHAYGTCFTCVNMTSSCTFGACFFTLRAVPSSPFALRHA
jgi:hypothetical protein